MDIKCHVANSQRAVTQLFTFQVTKTKVYFVYKAMPSYYRIMLDDFDYSEYI